MNITVYLGASSGKRDTYQKEARRLGEKIAEYGDRLIYGGSRCGLMGILAKSVIENGGEAVGVEPSFFVEQEIQYDALTGLVVTENMQDRKAKMIELGDAFIAFPGGTGTLEEISEVITLVKLGKMDKPFFFLNLSGYYEPLRAMYKRMMEEGFLEKEVFDKIRFAESADEIFDLLRNKR